MSKASSKIVPDLGVEIYAYINDNRGPATIYYSDPRSWWEKLRNKNTTILRYTLKDNDFVVDYDYQTRLFTWSEETPDNITFVFIISGERFQVTLESGLKPGAVTLTKDRATQSVTKKEVEPDIGLVLGSGDAYESPTPTIPTLDERESDEHKPLSSLVLAPNIIRPAPENGRPGLCVAPAPHAPRPTLNLMLSGSSAFSPPHSAINSTQWIPKNVSTTEDASGGEGGGGGGVTDSLSEEKDATQESAKTATTLDNFLEKKVNFELSLPEIQSQPKAPEDNGVKQYREASEKAEHAIESLLLAEIRISATSTADKEQLTNLTNSKLYKPENEDDVVDISSESNVDPLLYFFTIAGTYVLNKAQKQMVGEYAWHEAMLFPDQIVH